MGGWGRGAGGTDLHGDTETLVEGEGTALASHLADAVHHARELAGLAGTHIRRQASTGKIQRVHDQQRAGTRQATCTPPLDHRMPCRRPECYVRGVIPHLNIWKAALPKPGRKAGRKKYIPWREGCC